jgi:hypothetical protein
MHGLQTIIFLNANNREAAATRNARDPGHNETRRAEADLADALAGLNALLSGDPEPESSPQVSFGTDFVFQVHGTEGWLLPISHRGREIASRIFPDGFRRYGLHYILDLATERDDAILQSIHAAYA